MTITLGDGREDAREYLDAGSYAGIYRLGNVSVSYPEGSYALAREIARSYADAANLIALRMGIEWSFDLDLRIVELPDSVRDLSYTVTLRPDRKLIFPVFIDSRGRVRADWAPAIAHELTEASMIAPRDRKKMVLGDAYSGPLCIPTGTRWFRDGVSERAGDILGLRLFGNRYYPPASGYAKLLQTRVSILDWNNCEGAPNHYAAASALIHEAENRAGEFAISQVMQNVAEEGVPGGRGLRRAFEKGAGLDIRTFLETYDTAWLGADFADTRPERSNPPLLSDENRVMITRVYDATPAARWKLLPGDIVVSFGGTQIVSANQLRHQIARFRPGDRVELETAREGQIRRMRVKLISMKNPTSAMVPSNLSLPTPPLLTLQLPQKLTFSESFFKPSARRGPGRTSRSLDIT